MTHRIALLALMAVVAACGREETGDAVDAAAPSEAEAAPAAITVSGISSGAYMAGQVHVAHASRVDGAALIAGGPYGCALGNIGRALGPCINGDGLDVEPLVAAAREAADAGTIDALSELAGDAVWLFHGTNDAAVAKPVVEAAAAAYLALGSDAPVLVDNVPAAHGVPTLASGAACDTFAEPYLQACDYDGAGALLAQLLGPLEARVEPAGSIVAIDQSGFEGAGLADEGYAYVPTGCADKACRTHVVFHGCRQGAEFIGDALVREAGYNAWAEANDLVVLYPQVAANPFNPLGCWDWWGYTGSDYATRDGKQVAAIMALVDRLAEAP